MSIQWNKQYGMKDVAKFLNQEVDLSPVGDLLNTEVDVNKCAQVAAVVAIFGVLPAFTYGTVLGNLDAEREALISEISSLQAQVISATQASQVVYTVKTDKESYALGATTTITYTSATSTGVVKYSLHDFKGNFIKDLATAIPRLGTNYYGFIVGTSTVEKQDLFTVRVTHLLTNRTATSNKFEIKKAPASSLKVSVVNAYANSLLNSDRTNDDDQGKYVTIFDVSAGDRAIFIKLSGTRGQVRGDSGFNYIIEDSNDTATTSGTTSAALDHISGGVRQGDFVRINPYETVRLSSTVYFDPINTRAYRSQIYSVNYNTVAQNPNVQQVLSPQYAFETPTIQVLGDAPVIKAPLTVTQANTYAFVLENSDESKLDDEGYFKMYVKLTNTGNEDINIKKGIASTIGKGFAWSVDSRYPYEATQIIESIKSSSLDTATTYSLLKGESREFVATIILRKKSISLGVYAVQLDGIDWATKSMSVFNNLSLKNAGIKTVQLAF